MMAVVDDSRSSGRRSISLGTYLPSRHGWHAKVRKSFLVRFRFVPGGTLLPRKNLSGRESLRLGHRRRGRVVGYGGFLVNLLLNGGDEENLIAADSNHASSSHLRKEIVSEWTERRDEAEAREQLLPKNLPRRCEEDVPIGAVRHLSVD